MCVCREGKDGREGVVFLQPAGSEVSDRSADEPGDEHGILEDDRKRQGDIQQRNLGVGGNEENLGVLPRKSSQGRENQLGHA